MGSECSLRMSLPSTDKVLVPASAVPSTFLGSACPLPQQHGREVAALMAMQGEWGTGLAPAC